MLEILNKWYWIGATLSLGFAFVLSLTIAWVYTWLHRGAPYSRTFAQGLAVAGVVSALIVLAIGDSIARGIGLVGAVTVVRFRSNLKDPRDLIFAFAVLGVGVAAGAHAVAVAIIGTTVFLAGTVLVSGRWFARTPHDTISAYDAVLSFRAPHGAGMPAGLSHALDAHCHRHGLVRLRQAGSGTDEHAYQVQFRQADSDVALFQAVSGLPDVEEPQLLAYDVDSEI